MIKSFLIYTYVVVTALVIMPFGIIGIIFYLLGIKTPMLWVIYKVAQGWGRVTIFLTGSKINLAGAENIPKKGGVCFVSNHCGFFDIPLLLAYCGRPFGFIAKKELKFLPFINIWITLLGGLYIDRKSLKKSMKTINKGVNKIKKGGAMVIFPEGHRSKGRGLLPFHAGSLKLATQANAPIIPVAIEGSHEVFEKTGQIRDAVVNLTFCKPIETKDLPAEDKKQVLCDKIYAAISEKLAN